VQAIPVCIYFCNLKSLTWRKKPFEKKRKTKKKEEEEEEETNLWG